ncbi:MAG: hypothetical protein AAGA48_19640 [Myxococcota bacterium]
MRHPFGVVNIETATLPSNPNCVLFSTDAEALYGRRSSGQLMREMMTLAAPLHGQSGLAVLVGLGCRFVQDRRNQQSLAGTVFFVFDGPASADDLTRLERTVSDGNQTFSSSSIERVPEDAVWAGVWRNGHPYVIVESDAPQPDRWVVRTLTWDARYDPPVGQVLVDAESADLPRWRRLTHVAAPYTPAEEAVERMRLAFALHHALRVVDAMSGPRVADHEYFEELFPPDLVERLNLIDPNARDAAVADARQVLPDVLGHHDKLAMVGLLFSVSFSEGPLGAAQMRALRDAAHELGVTNEQVVNYLQRLW